MEPSTATTSWEPRPPGVRDMAPPLAIAPVAAAAIFGVAMLSWPAAEIAALVAVGAMVLIGWPVVFWMVDNGRNGPVSRTIAGAVCGAAPFAGALASGVIGLYIKSSDLAYVRWALKYGASVPYFGVVTWPRFAMLSLLSILAGIITMWVLKIFQSPPRTPLE